MPRKQPIIEAPSDPARWLAERLTIVRERSERARERRYQADRDVLVAVLSKIWPSHIAKAERRRLIWKDVVCIHSPVGQLAWGLAVDRADLFAHLERDESCKWDGHTPAERTARLRALLKLPTLSGVVTPRRRRARAG